MPDMMAVFFVMFGIRSYFRCCYQKSLKNVILFACGFGAAILSKPITLPLFAALALALFVVLGMAWWKRVGYVFTAFAFAGLMLCPWLIRNKMAFGEAGLTTISGTNLYHCNWSWLTNTFPENEKRQCREEMKAFEESVSGLDKMTRSKKLGDFAKRKIMTHLPSYMAFTIKKHPRMYAGTGTVALLRYLGLDAYCYALDDKWGSGNHAPNEPRVPYSACDVLIACGVQIFAWMCLVAGYLAVFGGCWQIFRCRGLASGATGVDRLLLWCPILSLLLLAAVIGPVTATRYRFIMIPFFSIIAAISVAPRQDQMKGI